MRCTRCLNLTLTTEDFHGQIIDTCPRCHGVWLSREEFERLVAHARTMPPPARARRDDDPRDRGYHDGGYRDDRRRDQYDDPRYDRRSHDSSARLPVQGRRRSWLHGISDLFD